MKIVLIFLMVLSCNSEQKEVPTCSLAIGSTYKICGPNNNNPFEKQAKATVIITDMKQGYVQYCWDYEYDRTDRTLFNRSVKEFIDQINQCNNATANR
jgi:hypothetical protein